MDMRVENTANAWIVLGVTFSITTVRAMNISLGQAAKITDSNMYQDVKNRCLKMCRAIEITHLSLRGADLITNPSYVGSLKLLCASSPSRTLRQWRFPMRERG